MFIKLKQEDQRQEEQVVQEQLEDVVDSVLSRVVSSHAEDHHDDNRHNLKDNERHQKYTLLDFWLVPIRIVIVFVVCLIHFIIKMKK